METAYVKSVMNIIRQGENIKLYKISGEERMQLPVHRSKSEVAIIVHHGEATLKFKEANSELKSESCTIILPVKRIHYLFIVILKRLLLCQNLQQ